MICDLQKANILKRVSAYILDLILLTIVITGVAFALSAILDYDSYSETLDRIYKEYEAEYGIDFDISAEDRLSLGVGQRDGKKALKLLFGIHYGNADAGAAIAGLDAMVKAADVKLIHVEKRLGGRLVTVGSDAHDESRVGQYCTEACRMVADVFGYVCTFENRKPIFHKL